MSDTDKSRKKKSAGPVRLRDEPALPWGYGADRVTVMPVDPERLFVYWEVTDEGIDRARDRLGSSGPEATLVLRVYDVSGRIFDGSNAHAHFDQEIDRADRQWFLQIGKPGSEAIVELGLRSPSFDYARIARSGRAEFPRRSVAEPRAPRWLTVRARDEQTEPERKPEQVPNAGPRVEAFAPPHTEPEDRSTPQRVAPAPRAEPVGKTVPAWSEEVPIRTYTEQRRHVRRDGAWTTDSWESGPQTVELEVPGLSTERRVGGVQVDRRGSATHVVEGPWEVVIRGLGALRRRRVLARWEIRRSWITEEGREVLGHAPAGGALKAGSSEAIGLGASERLWLAASEWRLAGASELLYFGASERRLGGASERSFQAASEQLVRGASERLVRGASERRLGGASERAYRGASERRLGGASDARPTPASKRGYPRIEDEAEQS